MATLPNHIAPLLGWRRVTHQLDSLPTGISSFDKILGGCPRGRLTEITGPSSSGRASFLHQLLAAATRRGEYGAVVDPAEGFDPHTAAQAGVDLDALLWVRAGHQLDHAMRAADLLLHSGGFGVIALDLCHANPEHLRRLPPSYWFRFQRAVEQTSTVLLVLAREPQAKSTAALQASTSRQETVFTGLFPYQLLARARYCVEPYKPQRATAEYVAEMACEAGA
ncbi:MAG: DNA recombination/repair protein RecA [Bryobacteraceae bacterium]|nr:DNA recombination/repair protein RecA [Bryobacteraceae bacterium]